MPPPLTPRESAALIQYRRELRADFKKWAIHVMESRGQTMAKHHSVMADKLQAIADGTLIHSKTGNPCRRLIIAMPPGSAKSQVVSVMFAPWFGQRKPGSNVLACSHNGEVSEQFSYQARNTVQTFSKELGVDLETESVKTWRMTNGSNYRYTGVGAGIMGYRSDLGLIDDYIGSEDDADSKLIRDKIWMWYDTDFWSRSRPDAFHVIVANRRHEDDLIGRILAREEHLWEVIKFPFFAKENDILGRQPGERLWPEYFTEEMAEGVRMKAPRIQAGLYGQEPAPEEGNYFLRGWLETYSREEYDVLMRKDLRIFGAGDWAVSTEEDANRTCLGPAALDDDGMLYILPDIFWKVAPPDEVLHNFVDLLKRRKPLQFWSESGHISKSWGPFLREQMLDQQVYSTITEVTPSKNKEVRAGAIRGRLSMHRVKFPAFAHWWPDAMRELLMFPGGKNDDFVDFIAHLGMGINSMIRPGTPRKTPPSGLPLGHQPITLDWVKRSDKDSKKPQEKYGGR